MAECFKGKSALITGAASGIGLAIARHLAREGAARLVLVDQATETPEVDGNVEWLTGDVSQEAFWDGARLGALDLAVVNAGISSSGVISDLSLDDWRRTLSVNLDGAFLTLRAALRAMRDGGAIVTVASASGLKAEPGTGAYGASKAGLLQLTRVAAKEVAARRIRVNAIAPAGVETPIWRSMAFFQDLVEQEGSEEAAFAALAGMATPLGRYATADEVAAQIAFLLSDAAATITGSTLTSDGGYLL